MQLQGIQYIPGENVGYNVIRRIGKYIQNKNLIHKILLKSIYMFYDDTFLDINYKSGVDCSEINHDVILDISDKILYYYEDNWDIDSCTEELADIFDQIFHFLNVTYSKIIGDFCKTII